MFVKAYRWYGGKFRMLNKLVALIPEHRYYYEPFMGSAALLLNHPRSELEVLNDLDSDLVCFMKTLAHREKGKELMERLSKLWYDKWVFDEAMEQKKRNFRGMDEIDKATAVYVLITQSFNGTRKNFGKGTYKDTNAYRKDICFHIPYVYERLAGVRVLNMDGIDLLAKIANNPDAFAMVDPPYCHSLRGAGADTAYQCELSHRKQIELLKNIRQARCKIILCGYREPKGTDLYDTYLLPYGWHCYKLAEVAKSCQNTKHKDIAEEFIWVNYPLPEHAKYVISMKEYRSI